MTENPEFDHLLHCVPDVAAAAATYTEAGLPAHANEPFDGFHNGGWLLDERYVEILTIADPQRYAVSQFGLFTKDWQPTIDRVIAEGGGGLNFAVNVTDVEATANRLRGQGHTVEVTEFRFEGISVSFKEAILRDAPTWAPFFITYTPHRTEIAEMKADHIDRGPHDLAGFVVATPEPDKAAAWLAEVCAVTAVGATVPLPGATVHFEAGTADRITTLLLTDGAPTTTIAGLRLRPAPEA